MATNNLNVKFNGDASGVRRASKEAQNSIKQFDNTARGALDGIAGAFGINTSEVARYSDALKGAIAKFGNLGGEGKAALSGIAQAAGGAASAMATIGIAAAVAGFKELNREAAIFTSTVEGQNLQNIANAYSDTLLTAVGDANGKGAGFAKWKASWKQAWADVKADAISALFGVADDAMNDAYTKAHQAEGIAANLNIIRAQERDLAIETARYTARIAELQETMRDTSIDANTRLQAYNEVSGLISEKYQKQVALQAEKLKLIKENNELVSTSEKNLNAEVQEEVKLINLQTQEQQELNSLVRLKNSILNATKANVEATNDETVALREQAAAMRELMASSGISSLGVITGEATTTGGGALAMGGLKQMWSEIAAAKEEFIAFNAEVSRFLEGLAVDTITDFASAIGELAGNLMNGTDAWSSFGTSMLTTLADLAITVGKIAIAMGVAVAGIQTSLTTLNPAVAIGAGAALVALGAWAKSALSNAASNAQSSSASVASSNYGTRQSIAANSTLLETMTIKVTGKLQAEGSKLVAVLNNENNRLSYIGA